MPSAIDLTGQVFGRLTCIERVVPENGRKDKLYWKCLCSCGTMVITTTGNLRSGNAKSCTCLQKELASLVNRTHGKSTRGKGGTYSTWVAMRNRCNNSKCEDYVYYGGKGIKVCERWEDYAKFLADMGERPDNKYSIDRINSSLDYSPENCRWATFQEQSDSIKFSKNWKPINIEGKQFRSRRQAALSLGLTKRQVKALSYD